MNEHDTDTFERFARRFAAIEPEVKDPPPLAVGRPTVPVRRRDLRALTPAVGMIAIVVAVAALGPLVAGQLASEPTGNRPAAGDSTGSPSAASTAEPTQASTVAPAPTVVCGSLDAQRCEAAIGLVREGHPREVAAAWAIVVDDVCAPTVICDRKYPFMSAVVLVPPPSASADPQSFLVVGEGYRPERVQAWTGSLPPHIVALIQSLP